MARKCRQNPVHGFKDNMAMVGIISTLLLQDLFIRNFDARCEELCDLEMTSKVMNDESSVMACS